MTILKEVSPADVMFIVGSGGVVYGVHCIYAPAAFIVGGLLLMVAGFLAATRRPE